MDSTYPQSQQVRGVPGAQQLQRGLDPQDCTMPTVQGLLNIIAQQAAELSERSRAVANCISGPIPEPASSGGQAVKVDSLLSLMQLISDTLGSSLVHIERAQRSL